MIVTDGDRYHLAAMTDVEAIDRAAADFDPSSATDGEAQQLARLLDGWHGVPFVDLADDPRADAERARLELVQSRLVESLALARLGGRADAATDAIIRLTVRTSTHPLHERAWELLVAGLHMNGQRTEALQTYARFADVLDRQLGVAPSRDFQQLRCLVDADETLDPVALFDASTSRSHRPSLASA
jgi:DNA-binding SARP family transcriptional activator